MTIPASSFANRSSADAVLAPLTWIEGVITGPAGTAAAILAVALFGFAMLRGELSLRRGAQLVLGCFILFSAQTIARGLYASATDFAEPPPIVQNSPPPPAAIPSPPSPYDPYAGASAPM